MRPAIFMKYRGTDSSVQVNEPVAEESCEKAEDNAEGDIEPEHEEVSWLEHWQTFIGESRESGESAAEARGQKQAEAAGGGGESGEQPVQQTDQKTACDIDNERGQRESAGRPDQQRYDVTQCAADKTAGTD